MTLTSILYTLGSAPMFAARPFLAAFVTALLARFGAHLPWLGEREVIQVLSRAPDWFTSNTALGVLGALAAVEIASAKSAELKAFMADFDALMKSIVALVVSLAVLDPETEKVVKTIDKLGVFSWSFSALAAGTVFGMTMLRNQVVALIDELDGDDDIGLQTLINWIENIWTVMGIFVLVLLPILAVVLSALTALGLYVARKRAERKEEASKTPCANCETRILPHATRCHSCGTTVAAPRKVGVFGQPKSDPTPDVALHRFELVARKRCPDCATRLPKRQVRQTCGTCGRITFLSPGEFQSYLAALDQRLPRTLGICFLLSAVPLLGVVPGVIYYRLTMITGVRGYIPPLRGCTTKWVVRFVNWGVIALQPVPLLGATIVPLMCWTNFVIYKRSLSGRATTEFAAAAPKELPA
jgi:Zn finger protein HypA/HybF involved in hydrogenase expression